MVILIIELKNRDESLMMMMMMMTRVGREKKEKTVKRAKKGAGVIIGYWAEKSVR